MFILRFIGHVRRWMTLIVFLLMLLFTVASHTVIAVAAATSAAIQLVTGATTVTSDAISFRQASAQRIKSVERENASLRRSKLVNFGGRKIPVSEAVSQTMVRLQNRTKKLAVANWGSAAGESIPFYGIAFIVGATGYELTSACASMGDIHDLQMAIDPGTASGDDRDYVCGLTVPTKEELWHAVKRSPRAAWNRAVGAYEGTSDWVNQLEPPDFSGSWTKVMSWLAGWL